MTKGKRGLTGWNAAIVVILSCAVILSGCSGKGSNGESSQEAGGTASPAVESGKNGGEQAAQEAPVEIKWMSMPSNITKDSYAVKYIEDKFNVKLDIYEIPPADYFQKQQIMLSTGDIPDVMFVNDPNLLFKYVDQGLIAEVTPEQIAQYAPITKETLDSFAPQAWFYTNHNGKNYGLPLTYYTGQFNGKQVWRTDLLKKAGVDKIPETIDEMTDAFAKLKKIGVYGMDTNGTSFFFAFWPIFGAYGVMPTQWMVKDGHVVNAAIQPEAKEGLTVLADWYAKGYIDPEFVTGKDFEKKFVEGKFAYYHSGGVQMFDETEPNSTISAARQLNPDAELGMASLPKGPEGKQGGWAWGTAGSIFAFGKQIADEPEKLQKILEIFNTMQNDDQIFIDGALGEKGKHWDYKDPAAGFDGGINWLPPYNDGAKLSSDGLGNNYSSIFIGSPAPGIYEKVAGKAIIESLKQENVPVSDIFGKSDVLPSSGKYWADLMKLKVDAYAQIIRGDKPISYFDDFVKQWNELGGTQLEQEANELYQNVIQK